MRIDAHQHFWRYNAARDRWITEEMGVLRRDFLPEDLLPELAAQRMDASVAVHGDQSEEETVFLLKLAAERPAIAGVVGWVDLRSPQLAERLRFFSQYEKLCGVRHIVQSEPDDNFLLREDFQRGIACLGSFDLAYDLLIYPKQLVAAIALVGQFPRQRFVIDHLAKPPVRTGETGTWSRQLRVLAGYPNVYCKVSGLITEAHWAEWRPDHFKPYLDTVFAAFGVDRLMFGSDWPVCLLAGSYGQVTELIESYARDLSLSDREKIFGLNAAQFYRLRAARNGLGTRR